MTEADYFYGLGGTAIAALVGASPWQAPIDVYRRATEGWSQPRTPAMRWGQLLEDAIADGYEEQTGRRVRRRGVIALPEHRGLDGRPFLRFHPDRLVVGEPGVLEIKASGYERLGWGEPGTDQVPPDVRVQTICYMGASGRAWCDIARLASIRELLVYRVDADPELYEALIGEAVRFWREHIETKVPPPPDSSDAYRHWLATQHPTRERLEQVATPEQALMVDDLRASQAALKVAEGGVLLVKNRLAASMAEGGITTLLAPGGKVTFQPESTRTVTAWDLVATAYRRLLDDVHQDSAGTDALEDIAAIHEATAPNMLEALVDLHTGTTTRLSYIRATFPGEAG